MTSLQQFLEQDKERFLQQCSSSKTPQETLRTAEDELSRILSLYNEQTNSEAVKQSAMHMIQAVRMSLPLIDSDGNAKIYSRTEYGTKQVKEKKSIWFWVLLLAAAACCVSSIVVLVLFASSLLKSMNTIVGLVLALAAMALFFLAGCLSAKKQQKKAEDLYAETVIDAEKVYHTLLSALTSIDKNLEDMKREEILSQKKKLLDHDDFMDRAQLDLLCSLLESAYAETDNDYAKEVISDIRFYLHKQNIETVEYSDEHKTWFDQMPSGRKATIRPALAVDGTLIRKGLASGGSL